MSDIAIPGTAAWKKRFPGTPELAKAYHEHAKRLLDDDPWTVDDDCQVEFGEGGAWVQAWLWIDKKDLDKAASSTKETG